MVTNKQHYLVSLQKILFHFGYLSRRLRWYVFSCLFWSFLCWLKVCIQMSMLLLRLNVFWLRC